MIRTAFDKCYVVSGLLFLKYIFLVKDVHLATVMTTVISRDITNKLYSMNAKLKPKYKDGKEGGNLDIRLPGIAGRLSQMDARQLEQFVTKETEKRQKEPPSENR